MSAHPLHNGKYLIVPAMLMQPSPGIGANDLEHPMPGAGAQVIFEGIHKVWVVERQSNGTYKFFLEKGGNCIDHEHTLWVNGSIQSGAEYRIEPDPREVKGEHIYLIKREILPQLAWTLLHPKKGAPVLLKDAREPYDGQLWLFRRLYDDDRD